MNRIEPRTLASPGTVQDEPRADVRRYLATLRRSSGLIAMITVVLTGAVVALSLLLPKSYAARATIVVNVESSLLGLPDPESQQRRLATLDELIHGSAIRDAAVARLTGVTADDIEEKVESAVDPEANLINVVASDGDPIIAATIANAVTETFLRAQRSSEQRRLQAAIARFRRKISSLETDPSLADEVAPIRAQISRLQIEKAAAGFDLQIAEQAEPPEAPASPRPVRNGIAALFASLFLGVLVALARDQLRPTITSPRELSQLTGLGILAGIPYVRTRFGRRRQLMSAIEHEAYQTLAAQLQLTLPARKQHVILVASAVHGEGKTTVTASLARMLARAGHDTLAISADLRWPMLHTLFGVPAEPGLTDLLRRVERDPENPGSASGAFLQAAVHEVALVGGDAPGAGTLAVLPPGERVGDAGRIFSGAAMHGLFEQVRAVNYSYVLVDTPPALGIADIQRLAQEADGLLWVSRLDRLTIDGIADMQELLARLPVRSVGHVVIGARVEVSPYYLLERTPALEPRSTQGKR